MNAIAYAALWMFVFSVPWESLTAAEGSAVVTKLAGMAALGAAGFAALFSGRLRRWHLFHVASLVMLIWAAFVLLLNNVHFEISNKFYTFGQLFLMSLMIWELARTRTRQLGLLAAYVLGCYVTALATLRVYRHAAAHDVHRFAAGDADPNYIAMTLALAIPMAWYLGTVLRQPLLRWAARGYLVIGLLAIVLTGSRGGMITTVLALTIVPLTMTRLTPGRLATAVVLLSLAGVVAIRFAPESMINRLASTSTEVEDANLGGRFAIWEAGLEAFTMHPITGYGVAGFKRAVKPLGVGQVAHNSYMSVLVEQGIVGFLIWTVMFLAVFRSILRLPTLERRYSLVLMATICLAMMPLTWEDRKTVWFVLSVLIGLAQAHLDAARGAGVGWAGRAAAVPPMPIPSRRRPVPASAAAPTTTWEPPS